MKKQSSDIDIIWEEISESPELTILGQMDYFLLLSFIHLALSDEHVQRDIFKKFIKKQKDIYSLIIDNDDEENFLRAFQKKYRELEASEDVKNFKYQKLFSTFGNMPMIYGLITVYNPKATEKHKTTLFTKIIESLLRLLEYSPENTPRESEPTTEDSPVNADIFTHLSERLAYKYAKSNVRNFIPREISRLLFALSDIRPGMSVCFPVVDHGLLWPGTLNVHEMNPPCRLHFLEESKETAAATLLTHGAPLTYSEIEHFLEAAHPAPDVNSTDSFQLISSRFENFYTQKFHYDRVILTLPSSIDWYSNTTSIQDIVGCEIPLPIKKNLKGEWLYILLSLQMVLRLKGKVTVLVQSNTLYRSGFEKKIIEYCSRYLNSVIALPKNMFPLYASQTYILHFDTNLNKESDGYVHFIDASNDYISFKNINKLSKIHTKNILKNISTEYSCSENNFFASQKDIELNGYNLLIGHYLHKITESSNTEESSEDIQKNIKELQDKLANTLKENSKSATDIIKIFKGVNKE